MDSSLFTFHPSLRLTVNPKYEPLRKEIETLPARFADGELIYNGRNQIRRFDIGGQTFIVKRFKRLDPLKRVIYTWLRADKALRSYRNSMKLLHRGVSTPEPIAYVAEYEGKLKSSLYYVSAMTTATDVKSELIEREPWNEPLLQAYARFVALLHEHGILHRDLNPTNVLYEQTPDGEYTFTLIDVNRMTFYDSAVPKAECMENLTLFWWLTPVYEAVLKVYASCRGWTSEDIAEAIRVKQRHDRRWKRRKGFTGLLKKAFR